MTRFLLLMKSFNLVKCEDGSKTQTRRKRWHNIKKGDEVYYRSNYKTTSGPYIAACDARWEVVRDMSEADCIAEGIKRYPGGWAHKDGEGYDASPQLAFLTLVNECCKERTEMDSRLCRIEWLPKSNCGIGGNNVRWVNAIIKNGDEYQIKSPRKKRWLV